MQLDQLPQLLAGCLSAEAPLRESAESYFTAAAPFCQLPGFGSALCQLLLAADVPVAHRQLAGVLLRQHVQRQWPQLPQLEHQAIRAALPAGLANSSSLLRSAAAGVVAAVAARDWPDRWPELLPGLLECVAGKHGEQPALGALAALREIAQQPLSRDQSFELLPVAMISGAAAMSNCEASVDHRCAGAALAAICVDALKESGQMSGELLCEGARAVSATLQQAAVQPAVAVSAVRVAKELARHLPLCDQLVQLLLPLASLLLERFAPIWADACASGGQLPDGEIALLGLHLVELLLLLRIAGATVDSSVAPTLLCCLMWPPAALSLLERSPHEFIATQAEELVNEPEEGAIRAASSQLLLRQAQDSELLPPIISAASVMIQSGLDAQAAGGGRWGVQCEAGLFAVGSLVCEAEDPVLLPEHIVQFIQQLAARRASDTSHTLVSARALWCLGHMAVADEPRVDAEWCARIAVDRLMVQQLHPLLSGACVHLLAVVSSLGVRWLTVQSAPAVMSAVCCLVDQAVGEGVHAALEAVLMVAEQSEDSAPDVCEALRQLIESLMPLLLRVWQEAPCDALTGELVGSCLSTLSETQPQLPLTIWQLFGGSLSTVLHAAGERLEAEIALELVSVLLELPHVHYEDSTIKPFVLSLVDSILLVVERSLDQALLQTGSECMRLMLKKWPSEPQLLNRICGAVTKLLSSDSGVVDPAALCVGPLATQLMAALSQELRGSLLLAVVSRLHASWLPALIHSLLMVLVKAILETCSPMQELLALLHTAQMPEHSGCRSPISALQSLLSCWCANHSAIMSQAHSRMSARGLALLLGAPLLENTQLLPWAPSDAPTELIREAPQPQPAKCVLLRVLLEHLHNETHTTAEAPTPFCDDSMISLMRFEPESSDEDDETDVHAAMSLEQEVARFAASHPLVAQSVQSESLQQCLRSCLGNA